MRSISTRRSILCWLGLVLIATIFGLTTMAAPGMANELDDARNTGVN